MSYERYLDDERKRSQILTGSSDGDHLHGAAIDLSTRERVEALLAEYSGEEGHVGAAQSAIDALDAEYERYKRQQVALGWPEPTEMPSELRERFDRACARRDVLVAERDKLREMLDDWRESEAKDRQADILRRIGSMLFSNAYDPDTGLYRTVCDGQYLALADEHGQIVRRDFNPRYRHHLQAIPAGAACVIDDRQSPYHRSTLGAYRVLCQWLKEQRNAKRRELEEANNQLPPDEREPGDRITARARAWRPSPWPPAMPEAADTEGER